MGTIVNSLQLPALAILCGSKSVDSALHAKQINSGWQQPRTTWLHECVRLYIVGFSDTIGGSRTSALWRTMVEDSLRSISICEAGGAMAV
jgi:hypothetical protein